MHTQPNRAKAAETYLELLLLPFQHLSLWHCTLKTIRFKANQQHQSMNGTEDKTILDILVSNLEPGSAQEVRNSWIDSHTFAAGHLLGTGILRFMQFNDSNSFK